MISHSYQILAFIMHSKIIVAFDARFTQIELELRHYVIFLRFRISYKASNIIHIRFTREYKYCLRNTTSLIVFTRDVS